MSATLKGSEKQVVWAEDVRGKMLSAFDEEIAAMERKASDSDYPEIGRQRMTQKIALYRAAREVLANAEHAGLILDACLNGRNLMSLQTLTLGLVGAPLTETSFGRAAGIRAEAKRRFGIELPSLLTAQQASDLEASGYFDGELTR